MPIISETPGSENLPVIGLVHVGLAPHRTDQIASTQRVAVTDANHILPPRGVPKYVKDSRDDNPVVDTKFNVGR